MRGVGAVGQKERMFGELGPPRQHDGEQRGVNGEGGRALGIGGAITGVRAAHEGLGADLGAQAGGVEEGEARMDDLEVDLGEIGSELGAGGGGREGGGGGAPRGVPLGRGREQVGEDSKGEDEESKEQEQKGVTSRPVVTIHVEPGGATAEQAHTASEEILTLLEAQGVPRGDVTVEWKEGHVRRWGLGENYVELEERPSTSRGDAHRHWETRTGIVGSSEIR